MPSKSVFVARIDKSTCSAPLQVLERAGRLIVFCVVLAAPLSCGDDHGCHLSNSDGNWNEFGSMQQSKSQRDARLASRSPVRTSPLTPASSGQSTSFSTKRLPRPSTMATPLSSLK